MIFFLGQSITFQPVFEENVYLINRNKVLPYHGDIYLPL